ncbi:hypothetical protein R1flu_020794 [Riccia fluitans]|uniref:Uncharacterized protein n=1 Tax=Riccia fluitans TaxID=41844 RepID=A0ABD1ZMI5_9MARC
MQHFRDLETQVREGELLHFSILRRRSRAEWTEKGEACTRYFFATLKAKQSNEKMLILQGGENQEVRDEELILKQVSNYYKELYSQPKIMKTEKKKQGEVLTLVDQLVSDEDNRRLMTIPDTAELDEIVTEWVSVWKSSN